MIKTESDFVNIITDYFQTHEFLVWKEVPNMGQSADIVASKNKKLVFVEAKLKNWTRAIHQCKAHELVADFIYIAIATKDVPLNLILKAQEKGYGVIHFDRNNNSCFLKLEAQKNRNVWEAQREILQTNLKKLDYVS